MNSPFDLVVAGGGPAGAVATLFAARAGLRTLLLDRAVFPREKACGDAIGGKAIAVLRELGYLDEVRRLPGAEVRRVLFAGTDGTELSRDLGPAGRPDLVNALAIRRELLDAFLFAKAKGAATECHEGFQVEDVERGEDGAVRGVRGWDVKTGAVRAFRGEIVLGADGAQSAVARSVGLARRDPGSTAVGLRAYYRNVTGAADRIELHYLDAVRPGYLWIFPLGSGLVNVGVAMPSAALRRQRRPLAEVLETALAAPPFAERFAAATRLGPASGGEMPAAGGRRTASGAGFLLLGDAAGLVDPFTGEGVANAMWSARLAVETARAALREGDLGAASLGRYEQRLRAGLGQELALAERLRKVARFRRVLNLTIRRAGKGAGAADAVLRLIAGSLPHPPPQNPLLSARLLRA